MEIVKLVQYGLTGVLVALAYLTFMLIKQEQQRTKPREGMLKLIRGFAYMCILMSCFALFGVVYEHHLKTSLTFNRDALEACQDSLERMHTYVVNELIDPGVVRNYVSNNYDQCSKLFRRAAAQQPPVGAR